jgi:hypothetical protein
MARVPKTSGGASRRAYQRGYSKTANNKTSRLIGGNKLRTPKGDTPSTPKSSKGAKSKSPERYSKDFNVSFGNTGYVEDFDV